MEHLRPGHIIVMAEVQGTTMSLSIDLAVIVTLLPLFASSCGSTTLYKKIAISDSIHDSRPRQCSKKAGSNEHSPSLTATGSTVSGSVITRRGPPGDALLPPRTGIRIPFGKKEI